MRTFVLVAYFAVAAWTAYAQSETAWFVLHAAGAVAGLCALGQAPGLAGERGALQRELYGPEAPDQAQIDIEEEDW